MRRLLTGAAAACAAGMFAVACGGSTTASHPAPGSAADTRVCEHYRAQRAFVRGDTAPTLADVVKVLGWISADVHQAAPGTPLARDLARMLAVMQGHGSVHAASAQVAADCQALGVKF